MVFGPFLGYLGAMSSLAPLDLCLSQALDGVVPVPPAWVETACAAGLILAQDICLPHDMPQRAEALRAGHAVAALDLVGASTGAPVPLAGPMPVAPGAALPAGMDAVLTEDGVDTATGWPEAIRPLNPGDNVRRTGHDGHAGDTVAPAGTRLTPRHLLIAAHAGVPRIQVRQPRVAVALDDPVHCIFAQGWLSALGARSVTGPADLTLRTATDHAPRLALAPTETAWLTKESAGLVLTVPPRFDAMVAACLALALPTLAHLTGATPLAVARPLARKLTSTVGLSELVLLRGQAGQWLPQPAGLLTLTDLAQAQAFAILPPNSEGLAAGAPLSATPIDLPFG